MKEPWYCSGVRIHVTVLQNCFAISGNHNPSKKKFKTGKYWGEYWGVVGTEYVGFYFYRLGYYALPLNKIWMRAYPQCKEHTKKAVLKYKKDLELWLAGKRTKL